MKIIKADNQLRNKKNKEDRAYLKMWLELCVLCNGILCNGEDTVALQLQSSHVFHNWCFVDYLIHLASAKPKSELGCPLRCTPKVKCLRADDGIIIGIQSQHRLLTLTETRFWWTSPTIVIQLHKELRTEQKNSKRRCGT